MTSNVDVTKPTEGRAYTADVRANFQIIKTEIETLQSHMGSVPGDGPFLPLDGGVMTGSLTLVNPAELKSDGVLVLHSGDVAGAGGFNVPVGVQIIAGNNIGKGNGGNVTIKSGSSVTGYSGAITLSGANGITGGGISLIGGTASSDNLYSGTITITGGAQGGPDSLPGFVSITSGSANFAGNTKVSSGNVTIRTGDGEVGSGPITIQSGYCGPGIPGVVSIVGGQSGGGTGGSVYISGGIVNGGANAGGDVTLTPGYNYADQTKYGLIKLQNIPVVTQTDPDALWNNNGVINIGAGGTPGGGAGGLPTTGGTMTGPITFDSQISGSNKITTTTTPVGMAGQNLILSTANAEGFTGSVSIRSGNSATKYASYVALYGGNSNSGLPGDYGGSISMNPGDGYIGGSFSAVAGNANTPDGRGGRISLRAGHSSEHGASSSATGRAGGGVWLWGGNTVTENFGGLVSIQAGDAKDLRGVGGFVSIRSGKGLRSGSITIGCESGTSVSAESVIDTATPEGGNLNLYAGGGYSRGGDVQISAGDVFANTTATDPIAGDLLLLAGVGTSAPNSIGGDVFIQSGRGELQGGNISISIGTGTTPGSLLIANLPTVAQSVPTALWNNAGVMNIGAGGVAGGGGSGLATTGGTMTGPIVFSGLGSDPNNPVAVITSALKPDGVNGETLTIQPASGSNASGMLNLWGGDCSGVNIPSHVYIRGGKNTSGTVANGNVSIYGGGESNDSFIGGTVNIYGMGGTNRGGRINGFAGQSGTHAGAAIRMIAGSQSSDGIIVPPNMGGMINLRGGQSNTGLGGLVSIVAGAGAIGGTIAMIAGGGLGLDAVGGQVAIVAGQGQGGGGYIQIKGGLGYANDGGEVYIDGGISDLAAGGRVTINGGQGGGIDQTSIGGNVQINGGKGSLRSGDVNISGGQPTDSSVAGLPGNVLIQGGNNYGVTPAKAGNVTIHGGSASGIGPAGDTIIRGGPTSGGVGDEILQAGNLILSPGINPLDAMKNGKILLESEMYSADGETSVNTIGLHGGTVQNGNGGNINIKAGRVAVTGTGGNVYIEGGESPVGTPRGQIIITGTIRISDLQTTVPTDAFTVWNNLGHMCIGPTPVMDSQASLAELNSQIATLVRRIVALEARNGNPPTPTRPTARRT